MRLLGLLNTEELRDYVLRKLFNLKNELDLSKRNLFFEKYSLSSFEGYYIYTDTFGNTKGYCYVFSEKGQIERYKVTDDLFEICYWIFWDITSSLSVKYEFEHRQETQDFRRIMFAKRLELLGKLGDNYKKRGEIEITEILEETPFVDAD